MPETHRSAVLLVYFDGYSYREASETLGVAIGTIMSRLSTARARIVGLMNDGNEQKAQRDS